MPKESNATVLGSPQQRFCADWLEARGIYDRPTLNQLMDMAEAYAAFKLRSNPPAPEAVPPVETTSAERPQLP